MKRLNNLEVAEVLKGHPEAINAYDDDSYIVCVVPVADTAYYVIKTDAGVDCTGLMAREQVVNWFLDLAIGNTSNDWEVLLDV